MSTIKYKVNLSDDEKIQLETLLSKLVVLKPLMHRQAQHERFPHTSTDFLG